MTADPWTDAQVGRGLGVPVAIGGRITPEALLGGHRRAIFCQPRCSPEEIARNTEIYTPDIEAGDIAVLPGDGNPYATFWWSPAERYVIPVDHVHMGRTLRKVIRGSDWVTTLDRDFDGVIANCRADRFPRWITDEMVVALRVLYEAGWLHTAEVWSGGELIGGLFGCVIGNVFIMESAFHTVPHAAKVAIVDLASRASRSGLTLLDAEVKTDYTVRLGAVPMPRDDYLIQLGTSAQPKAVYAGPESVHRLLTEQAHPREYITP
ncbi:MAG TPA: leucyl/phenylalanyl-tRNA--protein transferase [Streptosporangiaceae bacterium]|nr:leucyl/phenylalanyl-tRNA--protein transferase [Streptosporangiaceae bacterium]